jgi:hypothetical protein
MNPHSNSLIVAIVLGLSWAYLIAVPAQAIVVNADRTATSNPAAYQTKPSPSFTVWEYVGALGNGSGVYLGNGFVLTGNHVTSFSTFNLNGVDYSRNINEPVVRLKNPDDSNADLKIFQINGDPGLSPLPITTDTAAISDPLIMIGTGRGRGSAETSVGTGLLGYEWTATSQREKTWANNDIHELTSLIDSNNTHMFSTRFERNLNGEGQATQWDSGGGAFRFNVDLNQWELIGVPLSVAAFEGQDAETAAYGNLTYIADLTVYHDQIVAMIPEPASIALLIPGIALALARRRRR